MATFQNAVPKTSDFNWYSQNKLFLRLGVNESDFISVTLSQQSFQAVHGGKICLRYFYALSGDGAFVVNLLLTAKSLIM
ncbi:hypothetical protein [Scytonema sp. NUACC21]